MSYFLATMGAVLAVALGWLASALYSNKRGKRTQREHDKCLQDAANAAAEVIDEINSAFAGSMRDRLLAKAGYILDGEATAANRNGDADD